ncbi:hypothetical protein [Halocola ammonii]
MKLEYPQKIIIAWGEAIDGNAEIKNWLIQNGYMELGIFVHALYNQDEARDWLLKNEHPHLLALINAAEGNPNARNWLKKYKLDVLEKMALAADNDDAALDWLFDNNFRDMAVVAGKMRFVKNQIESDNSDMHRINRS